MEITPKKYLGQNFLKDANILRKEVAVAEVTGKTVLEIGPGDGRLTEKILEASPKKIIAVEKDTELAEMLNGKFAGEKKITIINEDFLELEPAKFKVDVIIGNIPYYISSQIIFGINKYFFRNAVFIVQKEFAEKMIAKPNESNYGRLSVTAQLAFNVKIIQKVPRHLFYPIPKVDSAMILLKPTGNKLLEKDEEIIRLLFQHRNQTVKNALGHVGFIAPEKFATRRVRTLTREECLEISKGL
jgi:16S rRNA (adenine1518-N6/adenine1519-N6)-dimethyltransferase